MVMVIDSISATPGFESRPRQHDNGGEEEVKYFYNTLQLFLLHEKSVQFVPLVVSVFFLK